MQLIRRSSLWPLLKRDGLALQYFALAFLYNYSIGHPLHFRRRRRRSDLITFVGSTSYAAIVVIHLLEAAVSPPGHLPDLYVVANVGLCATGFAFGWAWAMKRLVEESWALGFVG